VAGRGSGSGGVSDKVAVTPAQGQKLKAQGLIQEATDSYCSFTQVTVEDFTPVGFLNKALGPRP